MTTSGSKIKRLVLGFENDCRATLLPPESGLDAFGQPVFPSILLKGTRGYLERVGHQVNGTYSNGWYDACAVMIRRLIETLIIEAFEKHGISQTIKNTNDEFYYLSDLISRTLAETSWNLSRNAKLALPRLKDIGDKSAHSRRFNAVRNDIDKIMPEIRIVLQEMVYLAGLK